MQKKNTTNNKNLDLHITKTTQDLENMDSYQYKDFKTKNGGDQVYSFNMKTNGWNW